MEKNIRTGDILIFDGGDNWISKTICGLTKSTVSHAAMVYEGETMVEMGMKGLSVSAFEAGDGCDAHLMRLTGDKPSAPLAEAARRYIDAGVSYDFPALILLAGLLIYKEVRPTPRWQRVTDTILLLACMSADRLLGEIAQKGSGRKAMVCSQLVYQIYLDCGKDYVIEIGRLLEAPSPEQDGAAGGRITLAALMGARQDGAELAGVDRSAFMAKNSQTPPEVDSKMDPEVDPEALSRELYEALTEAESLAGNAAESGATADNAAESEPPAALELTATLGRAGAFLDKMEQLLEQVHLDIPLPALFITPADLYQRAANLELVGDFHVTRV